MATKKRRVGNLYRRGDIFWLRYMIDGRLIRKSLGTSDPQEAERLRKEEMRPLALANHAEALALNAKKLQDAQSKQDAEEERRNPPLTLDNAWSRYEAATNRPDSSDVTLAGYHSTWRRFTRWLAVDHPNITALQEVSPDVAEAYANHLKAEGVTPSTYNQHTGFLRLMWRVLNELIRGDGNPWTNVQRRKLKKRAHRRRAVTPEQLEKILDAADDLDLRDLLSVLAWTGQRLVDGVMLRFDEINFKRHVITVYPRKTIRHDKVVYIPLLPQLADVLRRRRHDVPGDLVFPDLARDYNRDKPTLVKRIRTTFEHAGLETQARRPGIKRVVTQYGAHSLRHFFATQALAAGVPAEIVKRITGHTSDDMLEGYEHIDAAMIGNLAERLSNGNGKPSVAPVMLQADQVRAMLDGMNSRNWRKVKSELMALADGGAMALPEARMEEDKTN